MRSKVDPEKARTNYAKAAFGAYAKRRKLNKTWEQLEANAKEAWKEAVDEVGSAISSTLDEEETFFLMVKLAMRDALQENHCTQFTTMFTGRGGLPGKVRLIIAPDAISKTEDEALATQSMYDALQEDHISQRLIMFAGKDGVGGKIRVIIAPDKISIPFSEPLQGKYDG